MQIDYFKTVHDYVWTDLAPLKDKLVENGYVLDTICDTIICGNEYCYSLLKKGEVVVQLQMDEIHGAKFYRLSCGRMVLPHDPNEYMIIYTSDLDGKINIRKIFNKIKSYEKAIEKDILRERRKK